MLFYRITLSIMTAFFSQKPDMILLLIIVIHSGIVFSGFAVYKSWIVSAVETTLHVNIIIISMAVYFWPSDRNHCIPSTAGVGVAFVCFLAILLHNIIISSLGYKHCLKYVKLPCYEVINIQQASTPYRDNEYREPLIDN